MEKYCFRVSDTYIIRGGRTNSKKNIPYWADIFERSVFVSRTRTIVFFWHTLGNPDGILSASRFNYLLPLTVACVKLLCSNTEDWQAEGGRGHVTIPAGLQTRRNSLYLIIPVRRCFRNYKGALCILTIVYHAQRLVHIQCIQKYFDFWEMMEYNKIIKEGGTYGYKSEKTNQ